MNAKQEIENKLEEFNSNFENLISNDNLNLSEIENITLDNFKNYKNIMGHHIEGLLSTKVNEKELVAKKNMNGKK